VFPARFQLPETDGVRAIAVDLVGRHVDKGRLRAGAACRLQQVQRSHGVHFKIEEGDLGCPVVRRLRGSVDDQMRTDPADQVQNGLAVADVERLMLIGGNLPDQALKTPTRVAFRTEKYRAEVVIY